MNILNTGMQTYPCVLQLEKNEQNLLIQGFLSSTGSTIGTTYNHHWSTLHRLQKSCELFWGCKWDDLLIDQRKHPMDYKQGIIIKIFRDLIGITWQHIAVTLGKKDHGSIKRLYDQCEINLKIFPHINREYLSILAMCE